MSENRKVLLVDDDKDILFLIGESLKKDGFIVFSTDDSEDALKIMNTDKFDCLVTDLIMPKKDGWDLIEAAKKNSLPWIAVTGYAPVIEGDRKLPTGGKVVFKPETKISGYIHMACQGMTVYTEDT